MFHICGLNIIENFPVLTDLKDNAYDTSKKQRHERVRRTISTYIRYLLNPILFFILTGCETGNLFKDF
jgi:hypothetical protein